MITAWWCMYHHKGEWQSTKWLYDKAEAQRLYDGIKSKGIFCLLLHWDFHTEEPCRLEHIGNLVQNPALLGVKSVRFKTA